MTTRAEYRNTLMWAYDRLTVDGLTPKEIRDTHREIGNVLLGRSSKAATYVPREWSGSAKIVRADGECAGTKEQR